MKEKITIEGRSRVLNTLFVALNLVGMASFVIGYHESTGDKATMFKAIGWILMMLSVGGIILFKGRLMMATVSRVIVGSLFIVSGLVKANDPIGFSYKLKEYFEDGALAYRIKELFGAPGFSLESLMDSALFLSITICILEIVLGVLVLIGGKIKLTSYLLLGMMLFFTALTWHTVDCNSEATFLDHDTYLLNNPTDAQRVSLKLEEVASQKKQAAEAKKQKKSFKKTTWMVSKSKDEIVIAEMKRVQCVNDCGCFGDALKGSVGRSLTPQESYWKDIILLYLVVWIFLAQWISKPNTRGQNVKIGVTAIALVGFFSWVFGWYFPIFFAIVALIGALWILRVGGRYLGNHYVSAFIVAALTGALVMHVMYYGPLKDYRPYAVGNNLIEQMRFDDSGQMPAIIDFNPSVGVEEASEDERNCSLVKSILEKNETTVVRLQERSTKNEIQVPLKEFHSEDYPTESYAVLDTIIGTDPALSDFEIKDLILAQKQILIVVSRDLNDGAWDACIPVLKAIQKACVKGNIPFIMVTHGTREAIQNFKKKYHFSIPIFTMDEVELKVIARSNPALLILEKAVVRAKLNYRSIPDSETFIKKYLN